MPQETVEVVHPEGLHARPAAEFVKLANRFKSSVRVRFNGREVNGKSIMAVMGLGANYGARVELVVEGDDAAEAFQSLKTFLTERSA
jgi:phosphocarrier protein